MPIKLDSTSRFTQTEPVIHNGREAFGLWKRPDALNPDMIDEDSIVMFPIDQRLAGRPDIIAQEQYGTPLLEWIIIMFNKPLNPLGWPKVGTVIRMPRRDVVARIL
jgi:hypothetical protein